MGKLWRSVGEACHATDPVAERLTVVQTHLLCCCFVIGVVQDQWGVLYMKRTSVRPFSFPTLSFQYLKIKSEGRRRKCQEVVGSSVAACARRRTGLCNSVRCRTHHRNGQEHRWQSCLLVASSFLKVFSTQTNSLGKLQTGTSTLRTYQHLLENAS